MITWQEASVVLAKIKTDPVLVLQSKIYKRTHKTFEGWCRDNGFKKSTVYKAAQDVSHHKRTKHDNVVYFIANHDESAVKVGVTTNIVYRMSDLQIANPFPLRLLGAFSVGREFETLSHAALDKRGTRIRGEWFDGPYAIRIMNGIKMQGYNMLTEKDFF